MMEKDLAQFVGKVVSLKNDEKLAYIVEITPYLVCVGQNDEESYQEFNENYEFIDEELQKSWDDFYIQYKAKKLLSSEDDSNEDEDEEWGIKDSFKKKIKELMDEEPSVDDYDNYKERWVNDKNDYNYDYESWKKFEKYQDEIINRIKEEKE